MPRPFTIAALLDEVAAVRGRPITLEPIKAGSASWCGVSISTADGDYIGAVDDVAALHRTHIILHEVAHLLLHHRGTVTVPTLAGAPATDAATPLTPPRAATHYGVDEERDAECLATTLAERAATGRWRHPLHGVRQAASTARRWTTYNALYRRLYPLWRALCAVEPGITLQPPPAGGDQPLPVRGAYRALYRRTIEIHDGVRLVWPYLDPAVETRARHLVDSVQLAPDAAAATAPAAMLAAAIRKRQDSTAARHTGDHGLTMLPSVETDEHDLLADAQRLAAIGSVFATWPLMGELPARPAHPTAHPAS